MTYLLDTNAISDVMYEHPLVDARMASISLPKDEMVVCTIVVGEVLAGIERLPVGRRRNDVQAKAALVLPGFRCLAVEPKAAGHYARLKQDARSAGVAINDNDLWIAATAITIGATLVTRDADFSRLPGLTVEDWTR
jgi:predicted nucleic acid-binding protein